MAEDNTELKVVAAKLDQETITKLDWIVQETGLTLSMLVRCAMRDLIASYRETGKIEFGNKEGGQ